MVVYGSVAVSKLGERIGRGNGYVDLDFATLKHCGSITDKTLIVTVVHDEQVKKCCSLVPLSSLTTIFHNSFKVYDTLPSNLFTDLDVPIDLIVTPTQVIRVPKRLPRPAGIKWAVLSQRRLGVVPVLQAIKDYETENGKTIVLKDEDTDVETNRRPKAIRRFVRRVRKGRSAGENGKPTDDATGRTRYRRKSKVNGRRFFDDRRFR